MNETPPPENTAPDREATLVCSFHSWRAQERESAPAFPNLDSLRSRPRPPRAFRRSLILTATGALAAALLILPLVPRKRSGSPTLALALPDPLLKPAAPEGFRISATQRWLIESSPSDFLLPNPQSYPTLHIP